MPDAVTTPTNPGSTSPDAAAANASQPNPVASPSTPAVPAVKPINDTSKQEAVLRERLARMNGEAVETPKAEVQEGAKAPSAGASEPGDGTAQGSAKKGQDAPVADIKTTPDYQKAHAALRRWQYPTSVLNSMKPEEVVERGLAAAREQANQDKVGNELAKFRRGKTPTSPVGQDQNAGTNPTATKPKDGQGQAPAEPAGENASKPNLPANGAKPWDGLLGKLRADPVLEPLAEQFQGVFSALDAHYASQLEAVQTATSDHLREMSLQLDAAHLDRARAQLSGDYKLLRDDANWEAVQERVYALAESGNYTKNGKTDWSGLVKGAVRLEFGDDIETDLKHTTRSAFEQQREGQSTPNTSRTTPAQAMSPEQKAMLALQQLQGGVDPVEVRKRLASA